MGLLVIIFVGATFAVALEMGWLIARPIVRELWLWYLDTRRYKALKKHVAKPSRRR